MEKYEIERLRSINIEEVAERLGLEVKRHKCLCCFHNERNPSMVFNLRKNTYCCYSCGAHGGTIDLAMHVLNKGFVEACQWLGSPSFQEEGKRIKEKGKIDVSIPNSSLLTPNSFSPSRYSQFFEHPWLSPEACHFLFDERKLDARVVRWCRLNSYKDWLQIPYYSAQGQLVGIQQRYLGSDPEQPRFRFRSGERVRIYNQQILTMLRPGESLYLCEGCSDCWSLLSAGHKAIAIPSATLLKPQDLEPLKELGLRLSLTFEMYPDQDEPGERLFLQLREQLPDLIRHSLPTACKDYSEYFCRQKYSEGKREE